MDLKKLIIYSSTSSFVGMITSIIYYKYKPSSIEEDKEDPMIVAITKNLISALPSTLILPSAIQKTFVNLYSVENPAIISYIYSISKSLPSLFGITIGRSLLIVSLAGILTKKMNKKAHLLSLFFGILVYLYSKLLFQKSSLKGTLNVFHGDVSLNKMADSEIRIYKSMIRNFRETDINGFLSLNQPIQMVLNSFPYFLKVSTKTLLDPFTKFIERESKILKLSKDQLDQISISNLQKNLKVKYTGPLQSIDQYSDTVVKHLSRQPNRPPDYVIHTEDFMKEYGNDIYLDLNNIITNYALPGSVIIISSSVSFGLTKIFIDESSEYFEKGKNLRKCLIDFGKRIWSEYSYIIFLVIGCGIIEYKFVK